MENNGYEGRPEQKKVATEGLLVHGGITLWTTELLITRKLYKYKLAVRSLSYIPRFSLFDWTDVGWTRIFGENGEKQKNSADTFGRGHTLSNCRLAEYFARKTRLSCVQLLKFCYFC